MFLLFAALAVVVGRVDKVAPLLRRNVPILLFFFYCAVSILWSDFPFVALKRWTKSLGDLGDGPHHVDRAESVGRDEATDHSPWFPSVSVVGPIH